MHFFKERGSGILAHVSSLPSNFGIGDTGPGAIDFVEFLYRSKQKYWQILPLTPVDRSQGFSPYSSISSMAGNPLLISPEQLLKDGLLNKADLSKIPIDAASKISFDKVCDLKERLLEKAYQNFSTHRQEPFDAFCHREAFWLDDFALYLALKKSFDNKPWYQWPEPFKRRDLKNLMTFTAAHQDEINKVKWFQYQFVRQWKALKNYANDLNIKIIGDLPFYISYDSVDVWSRREIFKVDVNGEILGVAGVPPDYFNADGQLWGMPVFHWEVLKDQRYDWWVKRIKKNLELVDILRLDHFRAFADYWEVPANEKTAIHGQWKNGPGEDFFEVMRREFGTLPFIAEDLGDISEAVYKLRDKFQLPGMKVLQFAFGDSIGESDHGPHNFSQNFVVYTGTHDNNTTRGWFEQELNKQFYKQIKAYSGTSVSTENIHTVMARLAQASVADTAILPLQDLLGLDSSARINTPASTKGNWMWRMKAGQLTDEHEKMLREWTQLYHR